MKKKNDWHKENKTIAFKTTGGKCDKCGYVGKFSIHHKNYNPINGKSIYSYTFEELYKEKIVEILCYKCHNETHFGENIDNCNFCGKLTKTARSVNLNIPYTICRKCFKEKGGINGNFEIKNQQTKLF